MHTEIVKQIDLLIEMAGSSLNPLDIESDLIAVNKEIQNKKQRLEDLKSMMNDTRYFNASSELVDKNIEVSLKSKITRLNRKIKEVDLQLNDVQTEEERLAKEIQTLEEKVEENQKYIDMLDTKVFDDQNETYQAIVQHEREHIKSLTEELERKNKRHDEVLQELSLHEQAKKELEEQKEQDEARLKEVLDNLNNPNAYIDEDLKKQDEEELQSLNDSLEELQKRKLEYLTDPNMIGADAKELIANHNYTEALNKIKELLDIVKSQPFMDVVNLKTLDEELEKKESERTELSNYIDSKNYAGMSSDAVKQRNDYLNQEISNEQEEIGRYEMTITNINENINTNLSVLIANLEAEITKVSEEIEEYQNLSQVHTKSRRTKANLENAILKKEKEKKILDDLLSNYKKDLVFQITVLNAISKMIRQYKQSIEDKSREIEELKRLSLLDEVTVDYIEEEKDKEKLKKINEEIRQIKNRQKYDKTPDEIYDQLEMLLAEKNLDDKPKDVHENVPEALDSQIDELFDEEKENSRIKVVDMIPAETIQTTEAGGTSYGA